MIKPSVRFEGANWEITAITLRCDYVGDFVTVMVNRDWLATCAWHLKHKLNTAKENKQNNDMIIKGGIDKCVGPDCPVITKYRDKLIEEEVGRT
jgi:hypothetical protein